MPRIRTLKPEILEDEKTSRLSDTAFRLFTSMIILADDHGNVRADARWLQAQIWWAAAAPPDALAALLELWSAGLVHVYGVRGGTYATLTGWTKHQRVDNAGKGRVPAPDDPDARKVAVDEGRLTCTDELLAASCGESRRVAANFGEKPLDQEGDQDPEGEGNPPRKRGESRAPASRVSQAGVPPRDLATWQPQESERRLAQSLATKDGLPIVVEEEAEKFREYYTANGKALADLNAGFRGWLRKVAQFEREARGRSGDPPPKRVKAITGPYVSRERGADGVQFVLHEPDGNMRVITAEEAAKYPGGGGK